MFHYVIYFQLYLFLLWVVSFLCYILYCSVSYLCCFIVILFLIHVFGCIIFMLHLILLWVVSSNPFEISSCFILSLNTWSVNTLLLWNHVEIKQFNIQWRSMQDLQNMVPFLWNLQEVWEDQTSGRYWEGSWMSWELRIHRWWKGKVKEINNENLVTHV